MRWAVLGTLAMGLVTATRAGLLDEKPVGWASTSGGTTGGAGAPAQEVSNLADLQKLAKEPGKRILLVKGRLGDGSSRIEISSDKTVFGLPGVGYVLLQSIFNRDYPVVQGATLLIAVIFVVANTMVDIVYGWLDPRISHE